MTSPTALGVRDLSDSDAPAVLPVAELCDIAEIGEPDTDLSDIRRDMAVPGARWFGVDSADGLGAYAWVARLPGHVALDADVRVRPGADPSVGRVLLDLVRRVAADIDAARPVHVFVHVNDTTRQQWMTAVGAAPVRHFWRMVIRLSEAAPDVVVPAGVDVRPVLDTDDDKRIVAHVIHTSFQDHFGHERGDTPSYETFVQRTHTVSGFDLGLWWLASVDQAPAAALIGRLLPGMGLVNSLGTLREFRGRGIGRALLLTAFAEMHARGLRTVVLGVDATNPTGAVALYESVGMRAEHSWAVWEAPPLRSQPSSGPSPAGSMRSDSKNV